MKRVHVDIDQVASLENLEQAFAKALHGSPRTREALVWRDRLDIELANLRRDILTGEVALGNFRVFHIRDPKPRIIHAPSFRERVLHYASTRFLSCSATTRRGRKGKGPDRASSREEFPSESSVRLPLSGGRL